MNKIANSCWLWRDSFAGFPKVGREGQGQGNKFQQAEMTLLDILWQAAQGQDKISTLWDTILANQRFLPLFVSEHFSFCDLSGC